MMKYKEYLARVVFDDEIDAFHGEIVNIRDVVTFQGQSVEELPGLYQFGRGLYRILS